MKWQYALHQCTAVPRCTVEEWKTLFKRRVVLNYFLNVPLRSVFNLETIPILHPHYHIHSDNTSRPVNLAVLRWLVSYEDENEYGNDNGNVIED